MNSTALKVALVNHSDTLGGASVVTFRLMNALRRAGVDARMVVMTKTSDSPYVTKIGSRFVRGLKFIGECFSSARANGWDRANLFTVSTASYGFNINDHPWIKEADIVILNWVNQGMLSLKSIESLMATGKPIVWTMHDMWPLTGVCHHSLECEGYKHGCGHCPLLRHGHKASDASSKTAEHKRKLYERHNVAFVAVSNWLKGKCSESRLLSDRDVRVIPNAFPAKTFITQPRYLVQTFDLDYSKNIILMGAARLDDPIKGLDYAIDALNLLFDNYPETANSSVAVLFGSLKNPEALKRLRFPYRHLGRVSDSKMLVNLYAAAKVVISTSICETLPGTLIEGQASGCLPVAFDNGGQRDIIDHKKNGYLAKPGASDDIAEGILWALRSKADRQELHDGVMRRFDSDLVAKKYISLFDELLNRTGRSPRPEVPDEDNANERG